MEKFAEATCFQTGSSQWKTYTHWPPANADTRKLYTHSDGSISFEKPKKSNGAVTYVSDPAKPVQYGTLPIKVTYEKGSRWSSWQVKDQCFVSTRPNVISFTADSLNENLTVTGNVKAHLFVNTTGTDADFIVKLIDAFYSQ